MNIDKYDIRDAMRYTWIEPLSNNENCKAWSEAALQEKIYREVLMQAYKEAIEALRETDRALAEITMHRSVYGVGAIIERNSIVLDKYPEDV